MLGWRVDVQLLRLLVRSMRERVERSLRACEAERASRVSCLWGRREASKEASGRTDSVVAFSQLARVCLSHRKRGMKLEREEEEGR